MTLHTTLTAEQAAAFLQVHKSTVQAMARSGALPGRKIGREWRFLESELLCHFTSNQAPKSGGCGSPSTASKYESQLVNMIKKQRSASTTSEGQAARRAEAKGQDLGPGCLQVGAGADPV